MVDRAYTVREIDALRRVCEEKWLYGSIGTPSDGPRESRSYKPQDKAVGVEELVRTYMLAGLTADDLLAAALPSPPTPTDQPPRG